MDGIAPAIDKVGAPEPKAPEAEAAAPTMDTTTAPSEPAKLEEKKPSDGGGLHVPAPKPVEVMSVPDTPINNRTPAGGTPRPELNIDEEPKEPPKNEDEVAFMTTGDESGALPAVSAPEDVTMTDKPADAATNGASKPEVNDVADAAAGDKRKLDGPAATNGAVPAEAQKPELEERAEKKARVEDVADEPTADADADADSVMNGRNGKPAKKEKKVASSAGRTARKTRSQGPVEAQQA
ncbi:hypothetical protein FZEAL_4236 [Fusarium zealandicum]|uniref:Uncharacterized protein n=1 Tax=Fusarium zealandicum TaxID=1053134 RepID=A0A8H4UM41_9HYPO|nr:hypothetical protein FZEAL_4236 [Fusarium zealandicum]